MSISDPRKFANDFEEWITKEFAATGEFTALVVLVDIGETKVTPICSTYFNVIGDEVEWGDIVLMFQGSGADWHGASFFPVKGPHGPLDNPTARLKLHELETRLDDDRLVLNEGAFFDKWGRSMRIDEIVQ